MSVVSIIKSISVGSFTDKNEYKKHPFWLLRDRKWLLYLHKEILVQKMHSAACDTIITNYFQKSFDYFIENPEQYDGASGDNELHKVGSYYYDIGAINHDMFDKGNFTNTFKRLFISDRLMIRTMEQIGDSTFHIDKRALLLFIVSPFRFLLSCKRRKTTPIFSKDDFDKITEYMNGYKINYRRIINFSAIALVVVLALIFNKTFLSILKIIG